MASVKKNIVIEGLSGTLKKQVVVKQYATRTVVSAYPDMSHIVPSEAQKSKRNRFKEAVAYAKAMMADQVKKSAYQANLPPGKTAYHAAIAHYLEKNK
jgi:hypothetical protein